MFPFQKNKEIVIEAVLRFAVGSVLLWFGLDKIVHPSSWAPLLPAWLSPFAGRFGAASVLAVAGSLELLIGCVLATGRLIRAASAAAGLYLLGSVFSGGITVTSVRDLALVGACLALFAHENRRVAGGRRVPEKAISVIWRAYVVLLLIVGILFLRAA